MGGQNPPFSDTFLVIYPMMSTTSSHFGWLNQVKPLCFPYRLVTNWIPSSWMMLIPPKITQKCLVKPILYRFLMVEPFFSEKLLVNIRHSGPKPSSNTIKRNLSRGLIVVALRLFSGHLSDIVWRHWRRLVMVKERLWIWIFHGDLSYFIITKLNNLNLDQVMLEMLEML